jgi:putative flavoprotein involved in K+ transport
VAPWEPESEPETLDFAAENVSSVVWCVGFASDFGWVKAPVLDPRGFPIHERGVTRVPGLFFIGLPWLHTWGSGRFSGVGRDAGFIVEQIARALPSGEAANHVTQNLANVAV